MESKADRLRTLGWLVVAALFAASIYLAATRIIQVDEAQQVFMSAILARNEAAAFHTYAPLHHLGPMAWIALHAGSSESIFLWNRMLYLLVFWLNALLLARICAGSFRPRSLLPWLLLASTLVPIWDYGFEIRHDNLLLCGLLTFWLLGREGRRRPWVIYSATSALAVTLQFVAFKAFLYWVPWVFILLAFPPPSCRGAGRLRLALFWLGGACAGLLAVRAAYALGGGWEVTLAGFRGGVATSAAAQRFSPLPTLARMAAQIPMITGVGLAAAVAAGCHWRRDGRGFLRWDSLFPELGLLICVLAAFLANPTPFPYNLLFLAPFLLVAAAAFWKAEFTGAWPVSGMALLVGIVAFCHGLPFLQQTLRHLGRSNDRQVAIMNLAETMTDPVKDRVFDGTGLVPTRKTIGLHWLIHTFTIRSFYGGAETSIRAMLAQNPASVIIPSYRTDWLPDHDKQFIQAHYYPLADDFWVLGALLEPGGGPWDCLKKGHYQILREGGDGSALQVDGRPQPDRCVLTLPPGRHDIRSAAPGRILVIWLGPNLATMPQLAPGDHRELFVNWY